MRVRTGLSLDRDAGNRGQPRPAWGQDRPASKEAAEPLNGKSEGTAAACLRRRLLVLVAPSSSTDRPA